MNKKYFLFLCFPIIFIILYFSWTNIKIKWIEIFKQDALLVKYNSDGRIDGEIVNYLKGKIFVIGNVVNGVKQGWETMYYENGKIKSRTFFVNGQPSGKGYLYTNKGKLLYSGSYLNGSRYGNWYSYYENGQVKKCILYGIRNDVLFSMGYERNGTINLKDMDGLVVSPYFYSIDPNNKSFIPLDRETSPSMSFKDIKDLYIIVVHAPGTKLNLKLQINSIRLAFKNIRGGTLKILNAFPNKGMFNIFIESHLYKDSGESINGMDIKYSIEKK